MRREGCGGGPGTAARRLSASRVPPFNITAQNTVCRCRQGTLYHPNEDSSNNSSFGGAVTWVGPRPELRHFMGMGPPPPTSQCLNLHFFSAFVVFRFVFPPNLSLFSPPHPLALHYSHRLGTNKAKAQTSAHTWKYWPAFPPPPTLTPIFGMQKNGIYRRTHFHGPFLMHKLLIHRLPPPLPTAVISRRLLDATNHHVERNGKFWHIFVVVPNFVYSESRPPPRELIQLNWKR